MCQKLGDFLILYGSQTGQSKAIAENLVERLEKHGLNPRLYCLSGTEKQFFLEKETLAIIILSTTGDGDYPDTASKFCRRLHKKDLSKDLTNLSFALLGLGDTNYNNFCASPKKVEKRLLELGAKKFYENAFCDDAVGTELTAEPWMENLIPTLKKHLGMENGITGSITDNSLTRSDSTPPVAVQSKKMSIDDLEKEFISKCHLANGEQRIDAHLEDEAGSCRCVWPKPSLLFNDTLNAITDLKVPVVMAPFMAIEYVEEEEEVSLDESNLKSDFQFPSQGSSLFLATLNDRRLLTKNGAKKDKYEITMKMEAFDLHYEPGDSFYFIIPNVKEEVEWLLKRLKLDKIAKKKCIIKLLENSGRKNAKVPLYLEGSPHSLQYIFTNLIDVRRFLSKAFVRYLADCCNKVEEKRRLLELVSTQGSTDYDEYIRNANLSILDVLHAFQSCTPSVERLLEFLPQLQPRPYSVASYNNGENGQLRFVYSLVTIAAEKGRFYNREGLATGFLTKCPIGQQVTMFLKKPGKFRLLNEHKDCPIIMFGPGSGVAPFIGFLERIKMEKEHSATTFTNNWLFFGCRNEKLDFLFREELETFQSNGILNRFLFAFSQDDVTSPLRYVQDQLRKYGEEISQLLLNEQRLRIYVCGDAKHMAVDVFKAFCDCLSIYGGKSDEEALAFCRKMQEENRYLQDVWT